jgi:transposase
VDVEALLVTRYCNAIPHVYPIFPEHRHQSELPEAPGHPSYQRLNRVLDEQGFDRFCEGRCRRLYHEKLGRPSLAPGIYFRLMMSGFFEGIDSERGIAWRVADSLTLRQFLRIGLDE